MKRKPYVKRAPNTQRAEPFNGVNRATRRERAALRIKAYRAPDAVAFRARVARRAAGDAS